MKNFVCSFIEVNRYLSGILCDISSLRPSKKLRNRAIIIVADVIEQVGKQLDVALIIGKSAEILNTVSLEQLDDALIIVIHSDDVLS